MSGRVYTDAREYADALRRYAHQEQETGIATGLRGGGLGLAARYATDDFTRRGVGRSLARRPGGISGSIVPGQIQKNVSGVIASLRARGLAGLQETGGRTKDHIIRPKKSRLLAFEVRGKGLVFVREVRHPGARLARRPVLRGALERALPRIRADIDRGLQQTIDRVIG